MGEPDTNRNRTQYYGGGINCSLSSDEGRLTFCESYEENLVSTQSSRRHPDGIVKYFLNTVTVYEDNQGAISLAFILKSDLIQSTSRSSIITSGFLSQMVT